MKKLTFIIFSLFLFTGLLGQKTEIEAVKNCFENYKNAILNDKGAEAAKYVDSRTLAYYTNILGKVKNADSAAVASMTILDKLTIFIMRHRIPEDKIKTFDGEELFIYAIENGMVGKSSVSNTSLGKVNLKGNSAKGQMVKNGENVPIFFEFRKEEGQWKIDLTALFPLSADAFGKMASESGLDENAYIFSLLEMTTGQKPGPEIWEPVMK